MEDKESAWLGLTCAAVLPAEAAVIVLLMCSCMLINRWEHADGWRRVSLSLGHCVSERSALNAAAVPAAQLQFRLRSLLFSAAALNQLQFKRWTKQLLYIFTEETRLLNGFKCSVWFTVMLLLNWFKVYFLVIHISFIFSCAFLFDKKRQNNKI